MRYKHYTIVLLSIISFVWGIRIPPNPCPEIFNYYKDSNGQVYGEAVVPYDNATFLNFQVNASFIGQFKHAELTLKMVTGLRELNDYTRFVVYNIFFPFTNVIPKMTSIRFNGVQYCSGPAEPVIPGAVGTTNVWHQLVYHFTRSPVGYFNVEPDVNPESTDIELPTKNPGQNVQPVVFIKPKPQQNKPIQPSLQPVQPSQKPVQPPNSEKQPADSSNLPSRNPDPVDQGLINILFPPPTSESSSPGPATFTSPSIIDNDEFKCGISVTEPPPNQIIPLIFNAKEIFVGEFPWIVALLTKKRKGSGFDYKCSGNLVSDKHVITAARCVQYLQIQIVKTDDILLVLGTNDLDSWQNNGAVSRKVRKVEAHPYFKDNSRSAHGDIAILTMDRPVQFSKVLLPICLWRGSTDLYPFTNKMGALVGFGQDEDAQERGELHSMKAKRADMRIVSQKECLTSPLGFKDVTSDRTFCTKSSETPTGPCIGDSGAGFFIRLGGVYYLRGIASAILTENGICDLSNSYAVFCDVAKFLDWVKKEIVL